MTKEKKEKDFHYQYGNQPEDIKSSNETQELKNLTWKLALIGPMFFAAIFGGAMLLIVLIMIGGLSMVLGGGCLLGIGSAVYLFTRGIQLLSSALMDGLGTCGLGLAALGLGVLFGVGFMAWIKNVGPMLMEKIKNLLNMLFERKSY